MKTCWTSCCHFSARDHLTCSLNIGQSLFSYCSEPFWGGLIRHKSHVCYTFPKKTTGSNQKPQTLVPPRTQRKRVRGRLAQTSGIAINNLASMGLVPCVWKYYLLKNGQKWEHAKAKLTRLYLHFFTFAWRKQVCSRMYRSVGDRLENNCG